MQSAPLFNDINPGPADGQAFWLTAQDGMRLRVGVWGASAGVRGTVLCFPGRTEYVEKYGHVARALSGRGFAVTALDWRGQGLADRLREDRRVGDVKRFTDYQKDVGAYLQFARAQNLPKPWFILGHSMGGCIGLRSAMEGIDVAGIAFSAPMWGIAITPFLRPVAWVLTRIMPILGRDGTFPPGREPDPYVKTTAFENNILTTDPQMFQMMKDELSAHPDLGLGGPSYRWLKEALDECLHLSKRPAPNLPCLTLLGTNERIVDSGRVEARMANWPTARFEMLRGAEHEVLMEAPETRERAFDLIADQFSALA